MSFDPTMEKKLPMDRTNSIDADPKVGSTQSIIYIDPEKEKAAFKKFDKYVLPVSVIFMVLSSLDRNNVSQVLPS
jgi:hypothetical protein